ncbi:S-adenosyl-L-methionine-dependent methyltransferase [Polychaeton citri CBS 116435]|uniref:S-adenosyl-L-methionine-dependent methyltransferase n=1 Tax=Polychaeton citri CBS 116435 TaxID=1314669 RepID=A0A9P4QBL5_9PEZI|nr:S-adenosyl-L-methionine-dependent methyltransferase [Polychaeton citri CBS 116435]
MSRSKKSKPGGARRGRGGGRGGNRGGGNQSRRNFVDDRVSFDKVNKQNEKFEHFYNSLNIVQPGPERDELWAALRRELPNSWRFCGSKGHALAVRKNLVERYFPIIQGVTHEGNPVELPREVKWYPEGLAYDMKTPKNVVRKYEPFRDFQRFLVSETSVGNISRQELVSMIPPLMLDLKPHHTCLDLCAAPGSKSAQLVELIHLGEEDRVSQAIKLARGETDIGINGVDVVEEAGKFEDGGRATGLLVANDVNYSRAQMLVHQVKRLNSPNLIVTNHDATMFPSIQLAPEVVKTASGEEKVTNKYLKFDRVLADVPCSGDGTTRKNPSIWKDWTPVNGLGLYITQVRILVRALQMLKVGGRVVYSTCSMNPIEDEAVVASAIERCGGVAKVKLLDVSSMLPGLKRAEGLDDWSVMARDGSMYESWAEAVQQEDEGSKIVPGTFPPEKEEDIPLKNCVRVYPHHQDTGGFFIAVLEKQSEIKAKPENESKCMKRDWTFTKPTITEVIKNVETGPTNGTGTVIGSVGIGEGQAPMDLDGPDGPGAAERQSIAESSSGTKRKAEGDLAEGDARAKRPDTEVEGQADEASGGSPDDNGIGTNLSTPDVGDGLATSAISGSVNRKRQGKDGPVNEEAFKFLAPDHPELESIYNFYQLHTGFPRDRFLVRNSAGEPVKGIYYSSALSKEILQQNERKGIKFVHAGVKMFMKQDSQGQDICRWRIQTEGLPIVEGWVGSSRVVKLWRKSTLKKLLVEMFPKIGKPEGEEDGSGWKALGEVGPQVVKFGMGCSVLRVLPKGDKDIPADEQEEGFEERLTLPLWRSMASLNLMLPKDERKAMLLRLYNEDIPLINHSDGKGAARDGENPNGKGSVPAQQDAEEVQEIIADKDETGEAQSDLEPELVGLGGSTKAGESLEADVIAREDRLQANQEGLKEDDELKKRQAMPERAGESDEANKTV